MINFDDGFLQEHARPTDKDKSPILFFHSFGDRGELEYEGYIYFLSKTGSGMAMLFSPLTGEAAEVMSFTKPFLRRCAFYDNDSQMRAAAKTYWRNQGAVQKEKSGEEPW